MYPHDFEGIVTRHDLGTYRYTVVFLPDALARSLGFAGGARMRTSGEVNDVPFAGAWQPARGRWYLMLGRPLLRDAGVGLGDRVQVRFRLEPADAVDVPEPLQRALDADAACAHAWAALTAGQRRGLAHRVTSARQPTTLGRRVEEVLRLLATGGPFGPPARSKRKVPP